MGTRKENNFSSKMAAIHMAQHYETLLVVSRLMESEHPFVLNALKDIAEIKKHFGNRCFLTRRTIDELVSRDLLSEEDIPLGKEEEEDDGEDD